MDAVVGRRKRPPPPPPLTPLHHRRRILQIGHITPLPLTFPPCNVSYSRHDSDAEQPCTSDWAALLSWCLWLYNGCAGRTPPLAYQLHCF
jgi:hypothetical protein